MSSYSIELSLWTQIHISILELEQQGLVTRTFRRLDPERQQAILLAILDEAAEKGPSAANIKEVAERVGLADKNAARHVFQRALKRMGDFLGPSGFKP